MALRRCEACDLDWPPDYGYRECLVCGGEAKHKANGQPMPPEEVAQLRAHADFERYYKQRGERPVSDPADVADLARLDASLALVAELNAIPVLGDPIPVEPLPAYLFGRDAHLLVREHPMDRDDA